MNTEFGQTYLYNDQLINGYYIRNFFHSHPTNAKPSDKDKSAFETIINNQSKRGWLPPITGIYYVGSQEDKKNKYFYYENE